MKFSIIIPTFNRRKMLGICLASLINQEYPQKNFEIIVVDDGSKDETEQFMGNLAKPKNNIRYFRIEHNGQGAARNLGMKKVRGKYISFIDDDCVVKPDYLLKIERKFKQKNIDAIGGPIINPTNKYIAWSSHLLQFSSWFPESGKRLIHNIPTANITYKTESIKGMGFNEKLGAAGYEDSLFNYDFTKNGKRILFYPKIPVIHLSWEDKSSLNKFFGIQKRTAQGFVKGGYIVQGWKGRLLFKIRFLNLLCPYLAYVFVKCLKSGYLSRFFYHLPLMIAGEFYKGLVIMTYYPRR